VKSSTQFKQSADLIPVRWIFGGLALVTLYFQTNLADPFNSPKLWVLLLLASWLSGYVVSFRKVIYSIKPIKNTFYIVASFVFFALLATIFSNFHQTAIFGDTQRRNGFVSYMSLAIIIIAASIFVRLFNIKNLYFITYFVGTISVIYALMQTTGNDFINWNNGYNPIITTLGNPNFAAAVMAVMGVITFSVVFNSDFKIHYRVFSILLTALLLFAIYRSNARQGLLSYILGTGLFLVIWLYGKKKKLGIFTIVIGVFIIIISILGMLQIGPLERYLYKPSVTLRGYYWQAGIEMLKSHPLLGVGMDSYGYYFKEYRDVTYPLNYGFNLTSSNAHNTFIQFFATGGIFLGMAYLVLNGYILKRAIFALKNLAGNNKLILAGVFSAWVAFHAQSLVSIDNLGISIWGWVLGGSIIGLSVSASTPVDEDKRNFYLKSNNINLSRSLISGSASIIAVILISLLYRGENNTYKIMSSFDLQTQAGRDVYKVFNLTTINTLLNDPTYKLTAAMNLVQSGFIEEGLTEVRKIHVENPRNLDALNILVRTYEQTNRIPEAVIYREKISEIDPWNADNYLSLGKNYKAQGDLVKARAMLDKILSFAAGKEIAQQAKIDLAQ
jgi:O-antigen ligase